jgi:membrane protein implicated in regulation of membrane protease activity
MIELLSGVEFWHWWVLGVALVILEIFAPGAVLVWMGISAGVVGAVLMAAPAMAWEFQWLLFAALSVVAIFVSWKYLKRHPIQTDHPALNLRGQRYVGRVFTLEQPIVNGVGKIRVDDSTWKVEGPDLPKGTSIKVAAVDGTILKVEQT